MSGCPNPAAGLYPACSPGLSMDPQPSLGRKLWSRARSSWDQRGRKRRSVRSRRQRRDPQPEAPSLRPGCWSTRRPVQRSGPPALRLAAATARPGGGAWWAERWQGGEIGEPGADVVEELCRAGVVRGDLVGLAVAPRVGFGMATTTGKMSVARGIEEPSEVVRFVEEALGPRWVLWSNDTAATLLRAGVRIATCWDLAAVHRLLFRGWRADPACGWAQLQPFA